MIQENLFLWFLPPFMFLCLWLSLFKSAAFFLYRLVYVTLYTCVFIWTFFSIFLFHLSGILIYCLLLRGTVIISFLVEFKRKFGNYHTGKWFQNLLNLCDQKRKLSVLYRLFFFPPNYWWEKLCSTLLLLKLAAIWNGEKNTLHLSVLIANIWPFFFLWVLCHF